MFNKTQVAVIVAEVRAGSVGEDFLRAYASRAASNAEEAAEVVLELLGPAGAKLAARAHRAFPIQAREQLIHAIEKMKPAEREAFARQVLGAFD
jgi:hypothetical protein